MNNEAFTAYPAEGELLLVEGIRVWILGVEKDVMINNTHDKMAKYNGK